MSVLQRKAQAGTQEHQARAMSVPKALRLFLAKVADKLCQLPLTVIGLVPEECDGDSLAEGLDDTSMFILLDGPYRDSGGIVLGHELVTALVQQQTMGQVMAAPTEPREMTTTDASLCAPLIEAMFEKVHDVLDSEADRQVFARYRFGARCENARLFGMALNANAYQVYKLTLDVAGGSFQASMTLFLPVPDKSNQMPEPKARNAAKAPQKPGMYKTALALQADLSAILMRHRRTLSQLSALKVGDTIAVPPSAFDKVELMTCDGRRVCSGSLGQMDGMRALQLHSVQDGRRPQNEGAGGFGAANGPEAGGESDFGDLSAMPDLGTEGLGDMPDFDTEALPDFSSDLPALPDLSDLGDAGDDLPDLPDLDGLGGDLPDLPDLPDLSDLPDLGETADGDGGLPDLPDLDGLPDLPELEDLPDLGDLPKMGSG